MRQVAGLIATYSSDEFGICSALFELGGMVVMHDASGCNSTYTTHDEPRWYDMDSLIFISAISEMEAIMGDDEKLIHDLEEAAKELHPAFIAVVGAPIPYMIGTDLEAIAGVTEQRTGLPCMGFPANGMQYYTKGISMALDALTERFCQEEMDRTKELSVNILGATPLDFSLNGSVDSIKDWIVENGMEVNACFAMGSSLEKIRKAGAAHVNLVVSYGGLRAARRLQKRYGTPYVVGVPFGELFAQKLARQLKEAARSGESLVSYQTKEYMTGSDATYNKKENGAGPGETDSAGTEDEVLDIVGESVCSASLAEAMELEYGKKARVLCPVDTEGELLRDGDLRTPEEDDLIREIQGASGVIADPLYRAIVPEGKMFHKLPHEAFSGRIYDGASPNLINRRLQKMTDREQRE